MTTADTNGLLPHLFRTEYSRMTAVLCRHFGLRHIEIAEDIASETFLKASESWPVNGIPANPAAWLYTVAKNKTKDYLKHLAVKEAYAASPVTAQEEQPGQEFEFTTQVISDSQLAMIFAVCNPVIPQEAQVCLALQVLCGFSVEEIASAFLSKTGTIKKRLQRARATLREDNFRIRELSAAEVQSRLDTVLRTLYLLFNEGYFSAGSDTMIRKELCAEAMRLAMMLTENPLTSAPAANALLALMCFQASRFDARTDENGEAILYDEQDRRRWDQQLIDRGNYYLTGSGGIQQFTPYHLEAAIAYWHTAPPHPQKWEYILQLYNRLLIMAYSPVTALNRTFAYAQVYGNKSALEEAAQLSQLEGNHYYHALLGYLYSGTNNAQAIAQYEKAIAAARSLSEKQTLRKAIERL